MLPLKVKFASINRKYFFIGKKNFPVNLPEKHPHYQALPNSGQETGTKHEISLLIQNVTKRNRSDGRSIVGVEATPTMPQPLCTHDFQPCDSRRVGVSHKKQ